MKVLQLVKTSVGAVWALRQMRELVSRGVEVHVAVPPGGPLADAYESAGVVVHPIQTGLPVEKPWLWPRLFDDFRGLVDDVRPQIIHSHFVGTTLTMRLALGRNHDTPRVFQVPGPLHLEHFAFRHGEFRLAGPADRWIASCRWTRDCYRRLGAAEERVFLSYYGTELQKIDRPASGMLRRELKVDAGTKLVGMVAFMYPPKRFLGQRRGIKGHEDFIDALQICTARKLPLRGVVIGGVWNGAESYEKRLRAYGRKRLGDNVHFLGTRDDVHDIYGDLDVAVHPSHSENVGGACESLIHAVPTIATDIGGFPDVVRPGETGWLVPSKQPSKLADAVMQALQDPLEAKQMALAGQCLVRRMFDIQNTAAEVHGIYHQILDTCDTSSNGLRRTA